jgi:hypothetical protein
VSTETPDRPSRVMTGRIRGDDARGDSATWESAGQLPAKSSQDDASGLTTTATTIMRETGRSNRRWHWQATRQRMCRNLTSRPERRIEEQSWLVGRWTQQRRAVAMVTVVRARPSLNRIRLRPLLGILRCSFSLFSSLAFGDRKAVGPVGAVMCRVGNLSPTTYSLSSLGKGYALKDRTDNMCIG